LDNIQSVLSFDMDNICDDIFFKKFMVMILGLKYI